MRALRDLVEERRQGAGDRFDFAFLAAETPSFDLTL
jgi:hypothetical protein